MKKVPRTVQPAHWSPNITVEEAMRAFRKLEEERQARRIRRAARKAEHNAGDQEQ